MSEKKEIEFEIEIDPVTGDVLFSRDFTGVVEIAKQINPDDIGSFECFVKNKPKNIDGESDYVSYCG